MYLEYLDKIIALITKGWCQHYLCIPHNCNPWDADCEQHCLYGAMMALPTDVNRDHLAQDLSERLGTKSYITWQDESHRTQQDVLTLLNWIRTDAERQSSEVVGTV